MPETEKRGNTVTRHSKSDMRAVNWRVVGLIVNARRIAQGLDVAALADTIGVSIKTVRRIEAQQRCKRETLAKVMAWTGESLATFSWPEHPVMDRRMAA